VIESLNSKHDRAAFSSGVNSLDVYLQKQAGQDLKKARGRFVRINSERKDGRGLLHAFAICRATRKCSGTRREKTAQISDGAHYAYRTTRGKFSVSRPRARGNATYGRFVSNLPARQGTRICGCRSGCDRRCSRRVLPEIWFPRTSQSPEKALPSNGHYQGIVRRLKMRSVNDLYLRSTGVNA